MVNFSKSNMWRTKKVSNDVLTTLMCICSTNMYDGEL